MRGAPHIPTGSGATETYRPPYLAAGIAALAVWILYVVTLAPTTWFWDTSEYIATAHILGIPHPPGNPLFVVLARAWELLLAPTGLSVAVRINLFSATMSALAHGFWFLVAHRILSSYRPERPEETWTRFFPLVGAGAAVALSATAFTVWNQSNVNEKVYTVSLFTIALLSWLAFRWRDMVMEEATSAVPASRATPTAGASDGAEEGAEATSGRPRRRLSSHALLLLMVYVTVLSMGNHLMAALAVPAIVVLVLVVQPAVIGNWRLWGGAAAVGAIALSINLFLPIRAELGPVINEAAPTCDSMGEAVVSIITWGRAGCPELSASLSREQYAKPSVFSDPTDPRMPRTPKLFVAQMVNYLQYFDWQWARSIAGIDPTFGGARPLFTLLFGLLALYGAWTHYRRDRTSWAYMAVLCATLSVGLVFYLNFRYGFNLYRAEFPAQEMHEVRERDYFYTVGFSVWGVWMGIGLAALWQRLANRLTSHDRPWTLASPVLAVALVPLVLNWSWASRAHDYTARDWAYNVLMSVEPYGILVTNGDNDTFPLWYLQEVEGIRRDVTVVVTSYLNTPWYVKQIRQLTTPCPPGVDPDADPTRIICQRPYRGEGSPELYRVASSSPAGDRPGEELTDLAPGRRPPTQSAILLTDEQIDEIAAMPIAVRQPIEFRAGNVEVTIPAGTVLLPSDTFLTAMLMASVGDRPFHFVIPSPPTETLNLRPYLVRHGLTYRLNNGPVSEIVGEGIVELPPSPLSPITGDYVDLETTETLLNEVFMHRSGIPDEWTHWVDPATQNIPNYYVWAHLAVARAHEALGNQVGVSQHLQRAEAWRRLAGL